MRTRGPALALLPLLALVGCGGSSGSSAGSGSSAAASTAPPSPSPSPAAPPLTKAQAVAAAKAINLTAADVGAGYTGSPSSTSPAEDKDSAAFAACVGSTLPSAAVADVSSLDFSKGSGLQTRQVSSDVTVVATAAEAKADLAAFQSQKATTCLTTFITKTLAGAAGPNVTFGPPVVTRIDTPAPGADGSFGYDVKATAKASGVEISFDVVLQAFLMKRCEVDLTVLSVGPPFPADERSALLSKLVAHATTAAV